ncbi:MAG: hypothetical protein GW947_02870 [Candidatus Pacebacteria bacterium]|nr:hypothetical protein [Candidatus Paceibacterota bacterium]PIR59488.1 MAG: hypothetical protein COU68_05290 [Candidatus Pacebacteria bacterium CG10_big_fil_rev_8_21_14_0_10_45_6]
MNKKKTLSTKKQVILAYPNGIDKLEIGSGENPETGYVHVDIQASDKVDILADARKLPLPDNFVKKEIRAVHIMEHFCHPEFSSAQMRKDIGTTVEVLEEMYRVLAPGGKFFMVTPDFEKITKSAAGHKVSFDRLQQWSVGGHLNMFDVHHWLWTHADANKWFTEIGFVSLADCNPIRKKQIIWDLNWQDPHEGDNSTWFKTEWYHWLFFEGIKP